jgi:hypothetical protein
MVPFMAINFGPADASTSESRTFSNWSDASVWASGLYDPLAVVDESITAKVKEVTADAIPEAF